MKTTITTRLIGLALGALVTSGAALAIDSKDNAALRYYLAWTLFDQGDRELVKQAARSGVNEADWFAPEGVTLEWIDKIPAELLVEAASFPSIDFGINYDKGPYFLVPHIGAMRMSIYTMVVGARLKLDAGDIDGAVDMIAAGYRISEHSTHDRILISSLLSHAIFHTVDLMSEYAESLGVLTDAHYAQIAHALSRLDRRDPFGIKEAVRGEREIFLGWVEDRMNEDDRVAVRDLLPELAGEIDASAVTAMIKALDRGDNLQPEIHLAKMFYNRALAVWDKPNAIDELAELDTMLKDGGFGPLGSLLGPPLGEIHERYLDGQRLVSEAMERFAN